MSSHLHVELVVVPRGQLSGLELFQHVPSVREGVLRVARILVSMRGIRGVMYV